ncbi:hypothetical protein AK88_00341 [Plasmodium fragile]|uniref:Uncharacterized protein n=1 Tax=Plasmodium fragile TaxID=5857 RepID=A0A0D9QS07_PLAFR|nr:uncharacterized protein AK88_00341 [Plasmodium fragile]KJP89885.1 hypothetical protein AK88_00341 [Plasmodium fragile]
MNNLYTLKFTWEINLYVTVLNSASQILFFFVLLLSLYVNKNNISNPMYKRKVNENECDKESDKFHVIEQVKDLMEMF